MSVTDRTIVLAGATSDSGLALARALVEAGARVVATGRSADRLESLRAVGAEVEVADATSLASMTDLAARLGAVDAVIPLVGGWRGGGGLAGQSDADFAALLPALDAVRATSRAFDSALRASEAGRFVIVSSTAVGRPLAGGANYAAVKAASEAWTRAVAQGFAKAARDAAEPLRAASVVFRAKALDPASLVPRVLALWDADATDLNDQIITLD
ncbi:NADP-dependent 3-hydroxy acid dehydrogenase YdfG [Microbacterium phyllosphaerae]|uniref:NADP-dependent 3-hydroxy acid dehydrogenase YdfG n=1 Tax=Microbacterium phyllosphaerae TaxID=124798 RepID=A0ABS4WUB6_9MICO|nr:SDR family NAD(P)-dependent oxidoreductase [Microbacterium phyllosphaerae]MBP2379785.1 NADP-dependent 3-hydroxy acid dehydrogenase YdfG [Microbacterium phyllosphaerae]MCS3444024.1 NADP-dependent 3-hydroxy acid dehydrogenase YdfG [Microbacterium phyllosphaerae]